MYETLTDRSREVFRAAHRIAGACGKDVLDTDCILMGIAQTGRNTVPCLILREAGIWDRLVEIAESAADQRKVPGVTYAQSPKVVETVEAAKVFACEFNHHYIGTEHIFLALLGKCDMLAKVCQEFSVEEEELRRAVYNSLGIDLNTDGDYVQHRQYISEILDEMEDDKQAVRTLAAYLKAKVPY